MKRSFTKKLLEKLEATLNAATFAEDGEAETARQLAAQAAVVHTDGEASSR